MKKRGRGTERRVEDKDIIEEVLNRIEQRKFYGRKEDMKILITGDRDWRDKDMIQRAIMSYLPCTIIEGGASGADSITYAICKMNHIDCKEIKADWDSYGRAAGPIRNKKMLAENPDMVLAFHNDIFRSKGTKNMCMQALKAGVSVKLYTTTWPDGRFISLNDLDYDKSDPNLFDPPDCICRNRKCGHPASKHIGPEGKCMVLGCECGAGGWT